MTATDHPSPLEEQIDRWRSHLRRRRAIRAADLAELEDHLREQIEGLARTGLSADEAFLVAVRRLGSLDALSREFAREHAERLWKQLVAPEDPGAQPEARRDALAAFALAVAAALAVRLPALFGLGLDEDQGFHARNAGLLVLPFLAAYFAWKRRLGAGMLRGLALAFLAAAAVANAPPFAPGGSSGSLVALHLPVALFLLAGVAYAGPRWREVGGRMDFVRFSGEWLVYYVLIALGGGVLVAFMALIFQSIGLDAEPVFEAWILPCGAAGAVLVAAWLVEAKQSVVENMAPVLTRLFTPLFAAVLLAFLGTLLWTGRSLDMEREVLVAFDLLLVLTLALLLYSVSARDPRQPPGAFDAVQLVLVAGALLADAVALWAIAARIGELGLTPNRVAALGLNLILLANLAGSAALHLRFLRGRGSFAAIERWQTDFLPVYALWAAFVAAVLPPAFGYA